MKYAYWKTKNTYFIRSVLKHPEVQPYMLPEVAELPAVSLKALFDKNLTIYSIFMEDKVAGIAVFQKKDKRSTVDVAFLPGYRGKYALRASKRILSEYQNEHNLVTIEGKIRKANKRSLFFARMCGFKLINSDDNHYHVELNGNG